MFERFTDRARRVVVLANEEARLLDHNYIGTEHLLLGLVRERDGLAAQVLESFSVTLSAARHEVVEVIGRPGSSVVEGHIPFTPEALTVLGRAADEARQLDHNYIGTEHLLLGLVHGDRGVAAEVLVALGVDAAQIRQQVMEILSDRPAT